jgi:xanthine dehydrogenase accessory factor
VLGTGDIASAIGWRLFTQGWGVVLLRDSAVPVLRRGMAFDDALEKGMAELDGVMEELAPTAEAVPSLLIARQGVVVANLHPAVLAA